MSRRGIACFLGIGLSSVFCGASVATASTATTSIVVARPARVAFTTTVVGKPRTTNVVFVNNSSTLSVKPSVSIVDHTSGGPVYSRGSDGCTAKVIAPKKSCTVGVSFAPRTATHYAASLVARGNFLTVTVPLSGTGELVLSPTLNVFGIGCMTSSTCVVTGAQNVSGSGRQASLITLTSGKPGPITLIPAITQLNGIACWDTNNCVAFGVSHSNPSDAVLLQVVDGAPGASTTFPSTSINGISCAGGNCLAVATNEVIPITAGTIGTPQTLTGYGSFVGVACTDASNCWAVTLGNSVSYLVPIANGFPGTPESLGAVAVDAIACFDNNHCAAVGSTDQPPQQGAVVAITNGSIAARQILTHSGALWAAACPSITICYGVGPDGTTAWDVTITNGTAGTGQTAVGPWLLDSIACPTPSRCLGGGAIDPNVGIGAVVPIP